MFAAAIETRSFMRAGGTKHTPLKFGAALEEVDAAQAAIIAAYIFGAP